MDATHVCPLPICARCEIEAAEERAVTREYYRKVFASQGHDYDDPNDEWNLL